MMQSGTASFCRCPALSGPTYPEGLSLQEKAVPFQQDMKSQFPLEGQLKVPTGEQARSVYNMPDNAYINGD